MAQVGRMVKELIVENVSSALSTRPSFFVTTFTRLPASEADALRKKLHTSHARVVVTKRRLGQRAVTSLQITGLSELLEGSVGLVLGGEDTLLIAKHLVEFRKTHEEGFAVRAAVIDGQLLSAKQVEEIAQLPPRPILLAQLVATIESPMTDLVFTLERLMGELAWVVEQMASKPPTDPSTPDANTQKERTPR